MTFPRNDDGEGWAWGLEGDTPAQIWERFSPAYEAQAAAIWAEVIAMGLTPELGGAGSEDGEFILGRDAQGQAQLFQHLEDPNEAQTLEKARREGTLRTCLLATLHG